jgi:hypothetical protein
VSTVLDPPVELPAQQYSALDSDTAYQVRAPDRSTRSRPGDKPGLDSSTSPQAKMAAAITVYSRRDTDEGYKGVISREGNLRIVNCPDDLQWISVLQRRAVAISSTISNRRHNFTPRGVTTIGRLMRMGLANMASMS